MGLFASLSPVIILLSAVLAIGVVARRVIQLRRLSLTNGPRVRGIDATKVPGE
jgi:hypothetical protein